MASHLCNVFNDIYHVASFLFYCKVSKVSRLEMKSAHDLADILC